MYTKNDKEYKQAHAIKKGEYKLKPYEQVLVDWVNKEFGINVLDFTCYTKETSVGYKQQAIVLNIERTVDVQKMSTRVNDSAVLNHFIPFLLDKKLHTDPLKADVWNMSEAEFPEIIIGYHDFEEIRRARAMEKAWKNIEALSEKYRNYIWTISTPTVGSKFLNIFFHTDTQIEECDMNGTTKLLRSDMLEELKKYDEYGYCDKHWIELHFDSKESFDKNYDGNWYYYYK